MYETYYRFAATQAIARERIAHAERVSEIHRAHIRTRAETRLHRAVTLARRDGLDRGVVARELADLLSDRAQN